MKSKAIAKVGIFLFLVCFSMCVIVFLVQFAFTLEYSENTPVRVSVARNRWDSHVISTEPPFVIRMNLNSMEREGNCVEMKDFGGYFSAMSRNETSWNDKYFGFTANASLTSGWLMYGSTNLTGGDFTYLADKTFGSYYLNNIYYKYFPVIPNGTEYRFRFRVCFGERPDFAIFYFGSGSSAVYIDDNTTDLRIGSETLNVTLRQERGFITEIFFNPLLEKFGGHNPVGDYYYGANEIRVAPTFATFLGKGEIDDACNVTENTPVRVKVFCASGEANGVRNFTSEITVYGMGVNYTDITIGANVSANWHAYIEYVGLDSQYSLGIGGANNRTEIWVHNSTVILDESSNEEVCYSELSDGICNVAALEDEGPLGWWSASTRVDEGWVVMGDNSTPEHKMYYLWNETVTGVSEIGLSKDNFSHVIYGGDNPIIMNASHLTTRLGFFENNTINFTNEVRENIYGQFLSVPTIVMNATGCACNYTTGNTINCTVDTSGDLNVTVTPNENVTEVFYQIGNWTLGTDTNIYVYNNTTATPDHNSLWIHLTNVSGNWNYSSSTEYLGSTCHDQFIDAGVCNITGIVANETSFYLVMMLPVDSSQYLRVQNDLIAAPAAADRPQWSANDTSRASPQAYGPTNNYGFEINCSGCSDVNFRTDFNGTMSTYTLSSSPAITNTTLITYWINFTQASVNVSSYSNYIWDAINASGTNSTSNMGYTVTKGIGGFNLTLNGTNGDITWTYPNITIAIASTNVTEFVYVPPTVQLWRNGSNVTNPEIALFGAGVYNYTANLSHVNYSADPLIRYLTIAQTTLPNVTLEASPGWDVRANSEVNVSCINTTSFDWALQRSGANVTSPYSAIFSQGLYNFSCIIWETQNYSLYMTTRLLSAAITNFTVRVLREDNQQPISTYRLVITNGTLSRYLTVGKTSASYLDDDDETHTGYMSFNNDNLPDGINFTFAFGNTYANFSLTYRAISNEDWNYEIKILNPTGNNSWVDIASIFGESDGDLNTTTFVVNNTFGVYGDYPTFNIMNSTSNYPGGNIQIDLYEMRMLTPYNYTANGYMTLTDTNFTIPIGTTRFIISSSLYPSRTYFKSVSEMNYDVQLTAYLNELCFYKSFMVIEGQTLITQQIPDALVTIYKTFGSTTEIIAQEESNEVGTLSICVEPAYPYSLTASATGFQTISSSDQTFFNDGVLIYIALAEALIPTNYTSPIYGVILNITPSGNYFSNDTVILSCIAYASESNLEYMWFNITRFDYYNMTYPPLNATGHINLTAWPPFNYTARNITIYQEFSEQLVTATGGTISHTLQDDGYYNVTCGIRFTSNYTLYEWEKGKEIWKYGAVESGIPFIGDITGIAEMFAPQTFMLVALFICMMTSGFFYRYFGVKSGFIFLVTMGFILTILGGWGINVPTGAYALGTLLWLTLMMWQMGG